MTAPITSNRPTTTRLHHYAGRHSHGSGIPVETFFAPAWGASTPVETFFAHAHPKWLIFDHFHLAGAIFLSQRHPKLPPGATQGRYFFHTAPRDDTESPPVCRAPRGMGPGRDAGGRWRGLAGHRDDAPSHTSATRPHCCGGRRRDRRARAGLEIDHSERSSRVAISRAGRRPPAHTAVGPHKAARPSGRAGHAVTEDQVGTHCGDGGNRTPVPTRHPEHQWGHKQRKNPVPGHSKRGRHQPTPCASALTHP